MSTPDEQRHEREELELEPEAVQDLEVDEDTADAVRGGPCPSSYNQQCHAGL